ncbi:hypothetical protein PGB90_009261 [Kerria lacca]
MRFCFVFEHSPRASSIALSQRFMNSWSLFGFPSYSIFTILWHISIAILEDSGGSIVSEIVELAVSFFSF